MNLKSLPVLLILVIAVSGKSVAAERPEPKCSVQHYTLTALPFRPTGINDSGQIVGTTDSHHAALWTKSGGIQEIAVPPGFDSSEGVAVNRAGHVIAIAINLKTSQRQGFTYADGKVALLSGSHSRPFAINDADDIAGEATMPNGATEPVVWRKSGLMELGGCCGGVASGINNHLEVVGNTYDQQGRYQAFRWDKAAGMKTIGPQNGFSSALAINDNGHVLVESFTQGIQLYVDGKLNRLTLSLKMPSHPRTLNDCDVVVGAFGAFADSGHAFVWEQQAGFRDLNDLIPPHSKLQLREATAINNRGEIVGWGEYHRDDEAGFILVPEP